MPRNLEPTTEKGEMWQNVCGMSESKMRGEAEVGPGEEDWERSSTHKVGECQHGDWCARGERGRTQMQNI